VNVFVLNAGSSSIKAAYFEGHGGAEFTPDPDWSAQVSWKQTPAQVELRWSARTGAGSRSIAVDEHGSAAMSLIDTAMETFGIAPDIVGHRVVHGLNETHCSIVDARVRALIEKAAALAPLHNRAALAGIDAVSRALPAVTQAADFDTAFHATLPDAAAAYPLPYAWFAERGIRRYGFHGISHRYCAGRTAELLGREIVDLRVISAHIGNGASLAAIVDGKSVDTTMGFTPLEGIMMGSRSGSIDPGLLLHLIETGTCTARELDTILNDESGLKGVSQISEDVRDVIAAAQAGAQPARLALDVYVHRLSCGIAAMAASAGGIDALSFTAGVGEHSTEIRARVAERLGFLGVRLDDAPQNASGDREIGAPQAAVRVCVVQAREEFAIARDVAGLRARDRPTSVR
jgi:acetate kinase